MTESETDRSPHAIITSGLPDGRIGRVFLSFGNIRRGLWYSTRAFDSYTEAREHLNGIRGDGGLPKYTERSWPLRRERPCHVLGFYGRREP